MANYPSLNAPNYQTASPDVGLGAFGSFLQNFASVYNKMKDSELEQQFKLELQKKVDAGLMASQEIGRMTPDYSLIMGGGALSPEQKEAYEPELNKSVVGGLNKPFQPDEQVVISNPPQREDVPATQPVVDISGGKNVWRRNPKAPKEYAPETIDRVSLALTTISDRLEKVAGNAINDPLFNEALGQISQMKSLDEINKNIGGAWMNTMKQRALNDPADPSKPLVKRTPQEAQALIGAIHSAAPLAYSQKAVQDKLIGMTTGAEEKHSADWNELIFKLRKEGATQEEAEEFAKTKGIK